MSMKSVVYSLHKRICFPACIATCSIDHSKIYLIFFWVRKSPINVENVVSMSIISSFRALISERIIKIQGVLIKNFRTFKETPIVVARIIKIQGFLIKKFCSFKDTPIVLARIIKIEGVLIKNVRTFKDPPQSTGLAEIFGFEGSFFRFE